MSIHYLKQIIVVLTSLLPVAFLSSQTTQASSSEDIKESFEYHSVGPFHQGYAVVQVNKRHYSQNLVDTAGNLILEDEAQTIEYIPTASIFTILRHGIAQSPYAIFDPANPTEEVVFRFDRYKSYEYGLLLEGNNASGLIGPNGQSLIPTTHNRIQIFGQLLIASKGTEQTAYDHQGQRILTLNADALIPLVHRPLSDETQYFIIGREGKFGLLNTEDQNEPKLIYDSLSTMGRGDNEIRAVYHGMTGVIDLEGNVKIPFEYQSLQKTLCEKSGLGYYVKQGKWGFYHPEKGITIPCQHDDFLDICNAYGQFFKRGGKWGMVSFEGEDRLPFQFDTIGVLSRENLIQVEQDGLKGIVDTVGKIIVPIEYKKVIVSKSITVITSDRKRGAYHLDGELFLPANYDFINLGDNGIWRVIQGDSTMYLDNNRRQITNKIYDSGSKVHIHGFAVVCSAKRWGVIDEFGKEVVPLIYDSMYGDEPRKINGAYRHSFGVKIEGHRFKVDAEGRCIEDCPDISILEPLGISVKAEK